MVSNSAIMQTNATIGRSAASTADIKAWLAERKSRVNEWLDGQSKYFSRLAGFAVTRRTVIRVNAIAALAGLAALCVEGAPLAAAVSAVCAAAQAYKLNREEGKGGER